MKFLEHEGYRGNPSDYQEKGLITYKGIKIKLSGFPGGAVVENLPANAGDTGSSPGLG